MPKPTKLSVAAAMHSPNSLTNLWNPINAQLAEAKAAGADSVTLPCGDVVYSTGKRPPPTEHQTWVTCGCKDCYRSFPQRADPKDTTCVECTLAREKDKERKKLWNASTAGHDSKEKWTENNPEYKTSEKGKARAKRFNTGEKGKAAAKRFKTSGTGKIRRRKAFRRHILTTKTRKQKRNLRAAATVDATNVRSIRRLIPYL